jgi:hypothetical protein
MLQERFLVSWWCCGIDVPRALVVALWSSFLFFALWSSFLFFAVVDHSDSLELPNDHLTSVLITWDEIYLCYYVDVHACCCATLLSYCSQFLLLSKNQANHFPQTNNNSKNKMKTHIVLVLLFLTATTIHAATATIACNSTVWMCDDGSLCGHTSPTIGRIQLVLRGHACKTAITIPRLSEDNTDARIDWTAALDDEPCGLAGSHTNSRSVHLYSIDDDGTVLALPWSEINVDDSKTSPSNANHKRRVAAWETLAAAKNKKSSWHNVGLMYEAWHAPLTQALAAREISHPWSIEALLRLLGTSYLENQTMQYDMGAAFSFQYHTIPEGGPYCVYRKRANETEGYVPDCANITQTLTNHANLISQAGVDFIVIDATNLPSPGAMEPPACPGGSCQGNPESDASVCVCDWLRVVIPT